MHDQTDGVVDVRGLIDPEVAVALEALPIDIGGLLDGLSVDNIADVREAFAQMPVPELSDNVERTDHVVDERTGLSVRVHRPIALHGDLPCVYWMHGGGLVLGSHVGDDLRFDVWCSTARRASAYRSTTGLHPRRRIRARSTTVTPDWRGSTPTPRARRRPDSHRDRRCQRRWRAGRRAGPAGT